MSLAHMNSILPIKNVIIPIDSNDHLFRFDHHPYSGRMLGPESGSIYVLDPNGGKFGGALFIEEGTTNKIASQGSSAQNWAAWSHWSNSTYWNIPNSQFDDPEWGKVFEGTSKTTSYIFEYYPFSFTLGKMYTISVYAKSDSTFTASLAAYIVSNVGGQHSVGTDDSKLVEITPEWQRLEFTVECTEETTAGNGGMGINLNFNSTHSVNGKKWFFAKPQLEEKPFPTNFTNGIRVNGKLIYSPSVIKTMKDEITINLWTPGPNSPVEHNAYRYMVRISAGSGANWPAIAQVWIQNTGYGVGPMLRTYPHENWLGFNNSWDGQWHMLTAVMQRNPPAGRSKKEVYWDGELTGNSNPTDIPDFSQIINFNVGSDTSGGSAWNGLIDELLISPRAASPEEVRSWYQSQSPLYDPYDQHMIIG